MKVLVVNAGSSSLKYQLIDMDGEVMIAKGNCERIGSGGILKHSTFDDRCYETEQDMPTHSEAFDCLVYALLKSDAKVIDSLDEISAIGHRVVQGGSLFSDSVIINDKVIEEIESLSELAPLHNPANVLGIKACVKVFGNNVPQVAVFDTSFHQSVPPKAYMYALPYEYYEKYGIRRYGFHGTSHRYVSDRLAEILGKDKKDIRMITCHLGNGCSISAIENGVCIDTTMGFTPLDGFMMGTRTGTLDPSVITFVAEKEGLTPKEISDLCNKKSGVLGISGVSNDNRDVSAAAVDGNERAALAIEMQKYQIAKFVGSYIAAMNGVDAIIFTGGIGENSYDVREDVCNHFEYLGLKLDKEFNCTHSSARGNDLKISADDSSVLVYVIPTNEELVIARDTEELVSK